MQEKRIIVLVSLALLVAMTLAGSHAKTFEEIWLEWGKEECNGDPSCIPKELVPHDHVQLNSRFCRNVMSPEIIFEDLPEPDDYDYCVPAEEYVSDISEKYVSDLSECGLP
ncbi:MAG: hypothetical protein JOS17DRAFT_769097, partial [Linnemannia elongata]